VRHSNRADLGRMAERLAEGARAASETTGWMLDALGRDPAEALSGATPYLRLLALAAGGAYLAEGALAAPLDGRGDRHLLLARHFADNILPHAAALGRAVTSGGAAVMAATPELLAS
jgi:hypothetical protein